MALATRHGKERVIGRALRHGLRAHLCHLVDVDTDQLGSFCGSVPRSLAPLQACRAKAELALAHSGLSLAIASEGSFGPHPAMPFLPAGRECMVFLDAERGLVISEELLARRTNFAHRWLTPADAQAARWPEDVWAWLAAIGFPSHAVLVRPGGGLPNPLPAVSKGIRALPELGHAIRVAASTGDGRVLLETDMRAHCNPTRMASIRQLSFRLVRRLGRLCPACGAPGWGLVGQLPGLPCDWCDTPTDGTLWELFGCVRCAEQQRLPRADGLKVADPAQCPRCNP
ncbi:MAG: DUF6671 family protein [Synechococcaceae cyanobacterium]|nr:DUF6671 family protein [Synechococcaceae cyanobacterium]